MTDLAEEQLHEEFARFRAEFQEQLRPPGAHAARRRVARRRRVGTAVAAGVVILALVGGLAAFDRRGGGQSPVGPTAINSVAFDGLLDQLGIELSPTAAARPGLWWGTATGTPVSHTFGPDYPAYPGGANSGRYPAGMYVLSAACLVTGAGRVTVDWAAGGDGGEFSCSSGGAVGVSVTLTAPDIIDVTVTAANGVVGSPVEPAPFVLLLTDPRSGTAQALLPPRGTEEVIMTSAGGTYAERVDSVEATEPGTYRLTLVCVGSGSVQVTLRLATAQASEPVTCSGAGGKVDLQVSGPAPADLSVQIEGSADAGFAYRVVRLP